MAHRVKAHDHGSQCLAFRPQGNKLATAGSEGVVKIWDVKLGADTKQCRVSNGPVSCLNYNSSGSMLVAGNTRSEICLMTLKPTFEIKSKF